MSDVVNLRRARKARIRAAADNQAAENRLRFGLSKAERQQAAANQDLERRRLAAHRRADAPDSDNA